MLLNFDWSINDFILAIKKIMTIPNLSDFASEEKAKARLKDYTDPIVRMLLLAMPAFLADSEILLKAVNKEYYDKLFVFVLTLTAIKMFFQRERENDRMMEELYQLNRDLARELRIALEQDNEKTINDDAERQNEEYATLVMIEIQRAEKLTQLLSKYDDYFRLRQQYINTEKQHISEMSASLKELEVDGKKPFGHMSDAEIDAFSKAYIREQVRIAYELKKLEEEEKLIASNTALYHDKKGPRDVTVVAMFDQSRTRNNTKKEKLLKEQKTIGERLCKKYGVDSSPRVVAAVEKFELSHDKVENLVEIKAGMAEVAAKHRADEKKESANVAEKGANVEEKGANVEVKGAKREEKGANAEEKGASIEKDIGLDDTCALLGLTSEFDFDTEIDLDIKLSKEEPKPETPHI